jgi:hypothetical protein
VTACVLDCQEHISVFVKLKDERESVDVDLTLLAVAYRWHRSHLDNVMTLQRNDGSVQATINSEMQHFESFDQDGSSQAGSRD